MQRRDGRSRGERSLRAVKNLTKGVTVARPGEVIQNRRTGERILFRTTARESDGELLQFDYSARSGAVGPVEHAHPEQEERFEIHAGTARFRINGKELVLTAGQTAAVPRGWRHTFRNDGDDELRMTVQLRPARRMETFFETLFGLGSDGKISTRGRTNLLQEALLAREYGVFLAGLPLALQRPAVAVAALIARLVGFRACYPQYSDRHR